VQIVKIALPASVVASKKHSRPVPALIAPHVGESRIPNLPTVPFGPINSPSQRLSSVVGVPCASAVTLHEKRIAVQTRGLILQIISSSVRFSASVLMVGADYEFGGVGIRFSVK
jgi:hypothetical protein